MAASPGRLLVVGTPIGNMSDLSARAREALAAADLIAAEDTRHTGQMLAQLGIHRPLVSLHEHNEHHRLEELVGRVQGGGVIALVSDAGTPLISDPGFALVRAVAAAGCAVQSVPGPSAVTAALSVAGLPTNRFSFEGFLPARSGDRRRALAALGAATQTLVFFEAPHRIEGSLADMAELLGPARHAVLARELTKSHETLYRGTLAELAAQAAQDPDIARGEITLVVAGATAAAAGDPALLRRALELLLPELPPARAAAVAAQLAGVSKNTAYTLALELAGQEKP
ncbi:MAG TPA: 16S rRNA (cytidine(1402)-2'-O)-methyltransferase [Steroidobacteraceae bacterium]|nr:16S rRNA (cytidine(1402)-2'-O)-methyltransferase [Steroidobacteraceae bacterium]